MNRRPFGNLFINAGAMKAGTSWLAEALRAHPDLHFCLEKEIHYFHRKYVNSMVLNDDHRLHQVQRYYVFDLKRESTDLDLLRDHISWLNIYLRSPMDDDWYADVMRPTKGGHWSCDFSNLYSELPSWAWRDIAASCANLRVLFMFRDPLKRLWSHLKFDLMFNKQAIDLEHWSPQQVSDYLRQPHIWLNAEYGEVVRRLKGGLEPHQLKFMFLPESGNDELAFLREIEAFVGLRAGQYPNDQLKERVNPSAPSPMPEFFADLFREDVERIKEDMRAQGVIPPQNWL